MPRTVSTFKKLNLVKLMIEKDRTGEFKYGQRELEQATGLSRPYIRKIAKEIGRDFPRNGFEIRPPLCICKNCGTIFRRPQSKIDRAENNFCEETCRVAFTRGPNHPNWGVGVTASSFSKWVMNQKEYKEWREAVLARAGFKCEISGRTDNLSAHHIEFKSTNPEKAFDPNNGLCLNKEVHTRLHQLASQGKSFDELVEILKKEFDNG